MDSIYSNNTQNLSFNMNMQIDQQTGPCMKSDNLTYTGCICLNGTIPVVFRLYLH